MSGPRNVAKVLAKLNTKIMPLEPSPGRATAIPAETAIDVAAALGAAGQGPGRRLAILVLCLRWWPGMFDGTPHTVGYRRIHNMPKIHDKVGDKERKLFLSGACCQDIPIEAPAETEAFRNVASLIATALQRRIFKDLHLAEEELGLQLWSELTKQRVPHGRARRFGLPLPETLRDRVGPFFRDEWARAIIMEYRQPNHCQTCTPWGRVGEIPKPIMENGKIVRVEWATCETCFGSGTLSWSVKRRARALQIGEHPFRNYLNVHHDGALSLLRELEWRGARALLRHLSDER